MPGGRHGQQADRARTAALIVGAWVGCRAPRRIKPDGAADSFLVLSGGGRRGRARRVSSPTAGLQQRGEGFPKLPTFVRDQIMMVAAGLIASAAPDVATSAMIDRDACYDAASN